MQPRSAIAWKLVTPPAEEVVDLDTAKRQCRVDWNDDDDYIEGLVKTARQYLEQITRRSFVTQTWRLTADSFPRKHYAWQTVGYEWEQGDEWWPDRRIQLPRPPLVSVTSVDYTAADGTDTTLAADQYQVDADGEPGRILPAYGLAWPVARWQANAVRVTYAAGYGAAADVPQPLKQAVLLLVGHWYANRETVNVGNITTKLDFTVDSLVAPYKIYGRCT